MVMRRKSLTWIAAAVLAGVYAEVGFGAQPQSESGAGEEKAAETYRVGGKRDGPSFFPRVHYPEVKPLKEGELDFEHYPTYGEIHGFLQGWAREYPQILELYSVGRTFEGREIWQVTVTNRETGKDTDKPAMFAEGGRHSGEIASSVSIVQLIDLLVTGYGQDPEITHLVDTKAFYLRPVNNPDGAELFLLTAQTNRSSVRPHDTDRDGLLDEDPGEDLDGDGLLLQMRHQVGEGKGNAIRDPRDPDRLMKMVPEGEGDWQVDPEGVDNDGDGKFNEDGIGGLDLHRNYPENWRPEPGRDATDRGFTQVGAGEYPLSEPETRAVVLFLLTHPNVAIGQSMDTPMAMHLRPPSTSRSQESMAPEDLKWYVYLDKQAKAISGYPWAGDVYEDYRNVHPFHVITGEPSRPIPLFGHGPDFGYFYFGSIWYNDELWNIGRNGGLRPGRQAGRLRRPGLERPGARRQGVHSLEEDRTSPVGRGGDRGIHAQVRLLESARGPARGMGAQEHPVQSVPGQATPSGPDFRGPGEASGSRRLLHRAHLPQRGSSPHGPGPGQAGQDRETGHGPDQVRRRAF